MKTTTLTLNAQELTILQNAIYHRAVEDIAASRTYGNFVEFVKNGCYHDAAGLEAAEGLELADKIHAALERVLS